MDTTRSVHGTRTGAVTYYGREIAADVLPQPIINASYEAAFLELINPGSLSPVVTGNSIAKKEKVGELEVEYAVSNSMSSADVVAAATPVVTIIGRSALAVYAHVIPGILAVWNFSSEGRKPIKSSCVNFGQRNTLADPGDDNEMLDWTPVIQWFGFIPDFHDAEVIRWICVQLQSHPQSGWMLGRTLSEVDERGYFKIDRRAVVCFVLGNIVRQEISDWNHQNVLNKLTVTAEQDGQGIELGDHIRCWRVLCCEHLL